MQLRRRLFISALTMMISVGGSYPVAIHAEEGIKEQVDDLTGAVKEKRDRIKELDQLIGSYKQRISDQEAQQASLQNQVLLLDTRVREKELAIQRARTEIDALTLEINQLDDTIVAQESRIKVQHDLIADLIRQIHQADGVSALDVFLTKPTLSTFFDRVEELKRLEHDLTKTVGDLQVVKSELVQTKKTRDERRNSVAAQQVVLKSQQDQIESERNFKISLLSETQQSQEEFERILYELQQQQQSTTDDISRLEDQLKDTLDKVDESLARGDILLNWPIKPQKGISAHFHDPTYPFRNLFAHPGTDIPAPVGTPVRAAAGGYVAWTKTGRSYGNYMMIVHPGGIATIYAHLTKFVAKPDTYIERGDIIGLSGGQPGMQGAGLSTGPHLHFEVRQDGIPVNAENFLPSL